MFTEGRIYFTIFFAVSFIIVLIFAYRKDLKTHKKFYSGVLAVLAVVVLFVVLFLWTKRQLLGS